MRRNSLYRKAAGAGYCRAVVTAMLWVVCMAAHGVVYTTGDKGPSYHSPYGEQYSGSFLPQTGAYESGQRGTFGSGYGSGAAVSPERVSGYSAYGAGRTAERGRRYSGTGHLSGSGMVRQGFGGYGGGMRRVLVYDPETETWVDDGTGPSSESGAPTEDGGYIGDTQTGTDGRQYRWTADGWVLNTTAEADLPLGEGLWLLLLPAGVYAVCRRKRESVFKGDLTMRM